MDIQQDIHVSTRFPKSVRLSGYRSQQHLKQQARTGYSILLRVCTQLKYIIYINIETYFLQIAYTAAPH